MDFYPNGTPKEYRSDLSFLVEGKVAHRGVLLVNHPITFKGITFYQASYGTIAGNMARLRLRYHRR
ncbi:MAG: cytochrome c biogenesis protein ResB [Deltaproteobacteria bacterium]|nr:cytochrome c biogenesis protein ResB [Deltaproteobacteria bacterium]